MQEEIHLIDLEQQQKEKVSRKLRKQSFCWTPSCKFKIQFSRVLLTPAANLMACPLSGEQIIGMVKALTWII